MAFYDQLNSFFTGETEEERKRREEEEARKSTPVKQTITTDPVTGEQTMKIEGSVQDLSSANPLTPTVTGPVAPGQDRSIVQDYVNKRLGDVNQGFDQVSGMVRDPEEYLRRRLNLTQPVAPTEPTVATPGFNPAEPQPGVPTAPSAGTTVLTAEELERKFQEDQQKKQQPTAATTQPVAATVPVAPTATTTPPVATTEPTPVAPVAQPTTAPTAEGLAMGPSMAAAPEAAWVSKFEQAQKDPRALAALQSDSRAPDFIRSLAAEKQADIIIAQRKEDQAKQKLDSIIQNNGRGMERAMKDTSEDGSVFKAYLYKRFGLDDLAKTEQEKLGANDIYQTTDIAGGTAVVRFGADGKAKSGVFATGEFAGQKLSPDELLVASGGRALGKGASLSSEVYIDKTNGQRYRSGFDNSGRAVLVNVQGGAPYRGDPRNLEVQSIGTSIAKAEGAKAVDLRYAGPIAYTKAGAEYIGKFNAENGTNLGYASQSPGAPLIDRNTGQTVTPGAGGTIRATTTAPVTTGGTAAPTTAPAGGTTKIMEAPRFRSAGFENESPAAFEARQKNWAEANKPLAKKEQNNQYFANETYDLIKPIAEQIKQSTGSGIGAGVDKLASVIGASPKGAEAISQLDVLSYSLLANVPRFEGPQSDRDVAAYNRAAGDLNNPEKPIKQRLAALSAIVTLLKKYDKDKTNDWTFGEGGEVDRSNPLLNKKK